MAAEPVIVLDVTRLISRLGQGPLTGIDRVEAAWLAHLQDRPHLLLARIRRRQMLLPPAAGAALLGWAGGGAVPPAGALDRLLGRTGLRARAETALSRMALARRGRSGRGLGRAARRALAGLNISWPEISPPEAPAAQSGAILAYLNVGHANLSAALWANMGWARRVLLIHDTIPLDHPDYTRQGQSRAFLDRFGAGVGHADLVLAISAATRGDVLRWRDRLGLPGHAPVVVAPIGTTLAAPEPGALPTDLDLSRPFFVALGTIEPRKNHALLLDAWDRLGAQTPPAAMPRLFIVGRRGWRNAATFARLDALPQGGPVRELTGLSDGAVAALLDRAHALLMPSHAEGFGLPLTEAAARGLPVIATPLPPAREILGDRARWLPADDPQAWAAAVADMAAGHKRRLQPLAVPTWNEHFALASQAIRAVSARA
ncbi:glycosyltransferase family 4 protein [Paracoccus luteus]|uniref:glycosyltransferase family 4 protein n=1 Tax=Paracoccus luteus TaxID=2508543 RepID=UPI00106F189F|nr:glycosyltransferase family 1 protein [Paracoccus luteus]